VGDIKAIPTIYNGIAFRSRLEAKWARFFDLAGWRWEYEPFDLGGWIPDFVLVGEHPTLVEVKPIIWNGDPTIQANNEPGLEKAWDESREVLILGANWPPNERLGRLDFSIPFGVLRNPTATTRDGFFDGSYLWWPVTTDTALLHLGAEKSDHYTRTPALDFCAEQGCYAYRISGDYSGDHHLRANDGAAQDSLAQATNGAQWRGA
jgi:hypothetical protein